MTSDFSKFTARLREAIHSIECGMWNAERGIQSEPPHVGSYDEAFNAFALELFALQFEHNAPYRRLCQARDVKPETVTDWKKIPAVPTVAFKELELSCLPVGERKAVFHSSGTTEHQPSRHFHCAESLAIYEASLCAWFKQHVLRSADFSPLQLTASRGTMRTEVRAPFLILAPPATHAPRSSLVHMFETVRRAFGSVNSAFVGKAATNGSWSLDLHAALEAIRKTAEANRPIILLGTAFSFVHLLDYLLEKNLRFTLAAGSRAMETGGYKGRSRNLPKGELHSLITQRLAIPSTHIVCEYGMSELSSQAYDCQVQSAKGGMRNADRAFCFPPWARVQIVSPETGREVGEGETGLIRVFDLANVFSVMAIQTDDLGIRRGDGFELMGRAELAETRGCSLMNV